MTNQHARTEVWINYIVALSNLFYPSKELREQVSNVFLKIQPFLWDIRNSQRISLIAALISLGMNKSIITQEVLSSLEDTEMLPDEKYILSLCLQLLSTQPEKWNDLKQSLPNREKEYFLKVNKDVLEN